MDGVPYYPVDCALTSMLHTVFPALRVPGGCHTILVQHLRSIHQITGPVMIPEKLLSCLRLCLPEDGRPSVLVQPSRKPYRVVYETGYTKEPENPVEP
jgi:hypothetical protein